MKPVLVPMPGNEPLTDALASTMGCERGYALVRHFPDGESQVRIESPLAGRHTIITCTLDRPDDKLVPLLLLAAAARDAGAVSVGLVAPYLAYMRQDKRFQAGETVSAQHLAGWISGWFNWLVTVDPHLHRIPALGSIYTIATRVVHAAEDISQWVVANVRQPLLIGPDEESAQWVCDVARRAGAPFILQAKIRRGDRDVEISVPQAERWRAHTPVLVDDIVSTARTMIETIGHLRRSGLNAPVCIAVHPVFAQNSFEELRTAGAAEIVSCDTIAHPSNRISLVASVAAGVHELLQNSHDVTFNRPPLGGTLI